MGDRRPPRSARLAVGGWAALEDVDHGDVGAVEAGVPQRCIDPLPGATDERQPGFVLGCSRRLADEHQSGARRAYSRDDPDAALHQLRAAGAGRIRAESASQSDVTRGLAHTATARERTRRSRSHSRDLLRVFEQHHVAARDRRSGPRRPGSSRRWHRCARSASCRSCSAPTRSVSHALEHARQRVGLVVVCEGRRKSVTTSSGVAASISAAKSTMPGGYAGREGVVAGEQVRRGRCRTGALARRAARRPARAETSAGAARRTSAPTCRAARGASRPGPPADVHSSPTPTTRVAEQLGRQVGERHERHPAHRVADQDDRALGRDAVEDARARSAPSWSIVVRPPIAPAGSAVAALVVEDAAHRAAIAPRRWKCQQSRFSA